MCKKIIYLLFFLGIPAISLAETFCLSESETITCPDVPEVISGKDCKAVNGTDENGKGVVICDSLCANDSKYNLIGKNDENCKSHRDGCEDGIANYQCVDGIVKCVKLSEPRCPDCIDSGHYEDIRDKVSCKGPFAENDPNGTECEYDDGVWSCKDKEAYCDAPAPKCPACLGKEGYEKVKANVSCKAPFAENDPNGTECTYPDGTWKCIDGEVVCDAPNPICSPCLGEEGYDSIGTSCSVSSNECEQTNLGTYECINGEVSCNAEVPICLDPCDAMEAPEQGVFKQDGNQTDFKFITKRGLIENGAEIYYSCVRTKAKDATIGVYDAGMLGWHGEHYQDKFADMIQWGITGVKSDSIKNIGWNTERSFYQDHKAKAQAAYKNNTACYVCGSIRMNGCFAPETEIKFADGSIKQAKEVKAGDELFNPLTKKAVTVERVIEGPEDVGMVNVKTANATLKVSQEHPMLTAKGLVQAKDLKAGDTIFNGDNQEVEVASVEILPVEEGQYVINFITKSDEVKDYKNRMLLSNGIISGDLTTQIELKLSK